MLLLKATKVTTGHQNLPKMGQNSIISSFFARRVKKALGQSPQQELEVGPRSGPYLVVSLTQVLWCLSGLNKFEGRARDISRPQHE